MRSLNVMPQLNACFMIYFMAASQCLDQFQDRRASLEKKRLMVHNLYIPSLDITLYNQDNLFLHFYFEPAI